MTPARKAPAGEAAIRASRKRTQAKTSSQALLSLPGVPDPASLSSTPNAAKPLTPAQTSRAVRALLARRDELDDRVRSRSDNVVGSMVGIKLRNGEALRGVGITYFVREKVDLTNLAPRERIPKMLQVGDERFATDVMVWHPTERHALRDTRILMDNRTQGTMTAFAQSTSGLFGMSSGHCLLGPDLDASTPVVVSMDSTPSPNTWTQVGTSAMVLFIHGGEVLLGGRGYVDCGLFTLGEVTLQSRAKNSKLLAIAPWMSLPGQTLYGVSTVLANSEDNHQRQAKVIGIQANALDDYCDVVLDAQAPGMRGGDSGMLWFTAKLQAAAIHCHGEVVHTGLGSRRITAMSAERAAAALGIQFRAG